ncbi:UPF0721 transmembrane protein [Leucobacter sp. Psy1]|uniref:sulfite exporter TauE/SafE family protein n=1 Tax=Leucobacter sp. Psy1 TaxID=2875729 RepID=UPI001CD5DB9A|nr:sulfite exporter TauE/SafE family protein [Leucobacter sp. Psy1]UBH06650.1 UPF0721 transmembrane protein [Leucobacter sp. Psy1]
MTGLLPEFTPLAWALLAVAALIVGLSKSSMPGANTISIAIFASLMPAKESTGALLLLLIVGDLVALSMYRQHADWRALLRLAPAVLVGLLAGVVFLALVDDAWVRRVIGVVLLVLVAITIWRRATRRGSSEVGLFGRLSYGSLGGFTTMVANAGGPVMSMYFLAARMPVQTFLGTAAWFFAIINLTKVPFSIGLGLITPGTLLMDLLLVPALLVGALCGRWIAGRISQRLFERAVLALTVLGALYLIVS